MGLRQGAQYADILIIMEKADKTLSNVIFKRKQENQPFTSTELLNFWKTIVNVFAYCTVFKITHNDIKPSNILLAKNPNYKKKQNDDNQLNELYVPKIADFGTSIKLQGNSENDDE